MEDGEKRCYVIRRLQCRQCLRIHHELPNLIIPYKRHEAKVIESAIEANEPSVLSVDESTLFRWRSWFNDLIDYWLSICGSLLLQLDATAASTNGLSARSSPVHERIGQWFGDGTGWLRKIVQPVANHHFWIHTRSACLSKNG